MTVTIRTKIDHSAYIAVVADPTGQSPRLLMKLDSELLFSADTGV